MKKSALKKMSSNSAKYVVGHGIIQKSKGRNYSATFCGIRNPRRAFESAINELLTRQLLDFDSFAAAERITKFSYKDDATTKHLGFMMHCFRTSGLRKVLNKLDDTTFSNTLSDYLRIIQEEGFQILLALPFSDNEGRNEKFYVCFHKENGILLSFDTYGGNSVNGGRFCYNWKPNKNNLENAHEVLSSGSYYQKNDAELIWAGDHDCREALRLHIRDLRSNGVFVTPWFKQPFMWLLNYMDTKDENYDYEAINKERLAMLPPEVQRALAVAS